MFAWYSLLYKQTRGGELVSIYIEGMYLPKEFDPDIYIELACGIDDKRYARLYNFHQGGLTEWCEVIPVPEHGKCIDADKLTISTAVPLDGEPYQYVHINNIKNAPTII